MKANVKRSTVAVAFVIAVAADALQIGLMPLFAEGFASPFDDLSDVVVGIILTALLGWHIAFIPSFLVKLVPIGDAAPTWTIAVLIATRGGLMKSAKVTATPPVNPGQARMIEAAPQENPPRILPEKAE